VQPWLLIAVGLQAAVPPAAAPAFGGMSPLEIGHVVKAHTLDFRLRQESGTTAPAPLIRGMIVQHYVAPNAAVGVGLSNLFDRGKSGVSVRDGARPRHSRSPAVTFALKF
jgi:hypothetical protein